MNTTLSLGHVGYQPVKVDDEPMTDTGRRNAATVEAWRISSTGNPVEAISLPHTAVSGHGGGNSSGGAGLDEQAGVLAWALYVPNGNLISVDEYEDEVWCSFFGPFVGDVKKEEEIANGWRCVRIRIVPVEEQG